MDSPVPAAAAANEEKPCPSPNSFQAKFEKVSTDVAHIAHLTKKLAVDDPRRVVHSIKVALAITLVSIFYYFDPLYRGFGVNAMWAVLTVVVVFEFSVGATLGKGVNRSLATCLGGMAGFGAHRLATLPGEKLEPVFLAFFVFIIAAIATFIRFFPRVKARFDYGLLIFILTFSLISVSGYRDDEVIDMAQRRITTILIGSSTAVVVCVMIWPVWAGTDLHKLVASNIGYLGDFIEEFGAEYFEKASEEATSKDDNKVSQLTGLKAILDSKNSIDTLVTFAKWEPRHGRFRYRHPWIQYQKIGDLTRQCAYRAEALHGYLYSLIQAPKEVKEKFEDPCIKMCTESGKALVELSWAISKMTQPTKAKNHIRNAKRAAGHLDLVLRSGIWKNHNLSDLTPAATVASLLADIVSCTEEIEVAVLELATLAKFKKAVEAKVAPQKQKSIKLGNLGSIKRRSFANHHVINIDGSSAASSPRFSIEVPASLAMAQQVTE